MNRYVRAVIAGAAGLLLVIAAPIPAAGDERWPDTTDCATGAFTGHVPGPPVGGEPFLELSGWVGPCPPNDKDPAPRVSGRFGFAYLGWPGVPSHGQNPTQRGGRIYGERLRPYESATGPTAFAGRFDFHTAQQFGVAAMPICLMRDTTERLACAVVELDEDVPVVTWVAVSDPRVQGPVMTVSVRGPSPTPNCGTCL